MSDVTSDTIPAAEVVAPAPTADPAAAPAPVATPANEAPKAPAADGNLLGDAAAVDPAKEGEKPADPAKADEPKTELKPEDYKLEMPEGVKADDATLAAFLPIAAKHGLTNEAVQAIITDMAPQMAEQSAALAAAVNAPYEAWKTTQETWQAEIRNDPEIGGPKLPETLRVCAAAMDQFCTPEFRRALEITGAGNHPAIVRGIHSFAKALTEGGPVRGDKPADSKSAADLLYDGGGSRQR